jgi:RNA polymerase sigma-70 factor (ECF subfamily)
VNRDWDDYRHARQGDETAWRRLVDRHRPRLTAMALLICGHVASAADCVQEAFVRLAHSPPHQDRGSLGGYLSTIVYRLAIKELYRRRRQTELGESDFPEITPTPLEAVLKAESDRQIASAIMSLDDVHRHVLLLRFYGGHSYEDIAELTHAPVGTVKSRLFYAVKACREYLTEKGVTHGPSA